MATAPKQGNVLLLTKLYRPGVTKDLVVRPRLLELLDAGLDSPLTLVVAPAGFGKTTLVSSWVEAHSRAGDSVHTLPVAWLSLDEGDGDRDVFLHYFIAAVRTIFPDACPETLDLLQARHEPPLRVLTDVLNNELEALARPFVVVLDELNYLHGRAVFDFLSDWMRHWPRQMHLVLLSRFNPPLPLAALRAKGLLTEIRVHNLRFSPEEANEYFRQKIGALPDELALSHLQQHLEGWIAGLKMVALSLAGRDGDGALSVAELDGDVYIGDYLMDEVFNVQSPAMREFLLRTSIVEQFSKSLGEALLDDQDDACACFDALETADLFVTPLDKQHEWYAYHAIFHDTLQRRLARTLTPPQIGVLHLRAAEWFADHGLPDQAIHHALQGGDPAVAVRAMERSLCETLNREDTAVLERWLRQLPETYIRQSPELLLMQGWAHNFRWEIGEAARQAILAEALLAEADRSERTQLLRGQIAIMKGQACFHANRYEDAVAFCEEGLALLPETWRFARGGCGVYLGASLYAGGRATEAEKFLLGQYAAAADKTDSYALRLLLALAVNYIQAGYYESAKRTTQAMLRQATQSRLSVVRGWSHYLLGLIHYEWNELDEAEQHFGEVSDIFFLTQRVVGRNGIIGQALVHQARDRSADALSALDRLSGIDLQFDGREKPDTAATRARLFLAQSDLERAERWADQYVEPPDDSALLPWLGHPQLILARCLIARNKTGDVLRALHILDIVGETAESTFNVRITIEVLALRALAKVTQGDSAGARATLISSVELARRGIFIRVYVDLGLPMRRLMTQIAGHGPTAKSVARVLAAFASPAIGPAAPTGNEALSLDGDDPGDSLTPRELDVLGLLREPISLKAIAARLNISYATARRYTINIYSKFGVHSRWEAVESAIQRGIIAPY
jgi:LuxR family maltose regulon positive regulatory protein